MIQFAAFLSYHERSLSLGLIVLTSNFFFFVYGTSGDFMEYLLLLYVSIIQLFYYYQSLSSIVGLATVRCGKVRLLSPMITEYSGAT